MNTGAIITQGPKPWQIIQQYEGKVDIHLEGISAEQGIVYVRIVLEDTGESVVKWKKAELLEVKKWKYTIKDVPVGGLYRIETCLSVEENQSREWSTRGDMIRIIQDTRSSIKGILWYQGCSDTEPLEKAQSYLKRFENMLNHLREELELSYLPILTVQLNKGVNIVEDQERSDLGWSLIREAQRRAARELNDVYVVPSIDCTLSDCIHNNAQSNLIIGERVIVGDARVSCGSGRAAKGYVPMDIEGELPVILFEAVKVVD